MLQQKERSTALIAILTNKEEIEKAKEFERSLTIVKIVNDALPICEVRKTVGFKAIAQAIDIQLTRLVGSLNLKWNLSDSQIRQIVEDLIDKYPNETIEDFMLIFKKARQNEFGELYRLDSAVIFGWMDKYLDEKYEVIERKMMAEKDNHYKPVKPVGSKEPDEDGFSESLWHEAWLENLSRTVKPIQKIPDLPDEYYKKYGKEKPIRVSRTAGYSYFDVRGVQIYASTQEHANELAEEMLRHGLLEEDI